MTFEELHNRLMEAHPPTPTNLILYPELYRNYLDEKDQAIKAAREEAYNKREGIRVGDWIRFSDGVERRMTFDWGDDVQSGDGSFYMGDGYASYSGSLYLSIPKLALTLTDEMKPAWFWFFKHNVSGAGRGKDFQIPVKVYTANVPAPKC